MGSTMNLGVPGSATLDQRQLYRLDTVNLVLAKLASLELRNYRFLDRVARIAYADGEFYFVPADPRQQTVRMDGNVEGVARVWRGFKFTRPDMNLLRALAAFVLEKRKVEGGLLAGAIMVNFDQDRLAPVRCRYDVVVDAFRFAGVFTKTDIAADR